MNPSELDLGGIWTTPDTKFKAAGGGSFVDGRFKITVYGNDDPFLDKISAGMLEYPTLHLTNTLNSGSLMDTFNTESQSNLQGFTALTFIGHEFVKGVFVDSRDEPLGSTWTIVSAALRPFRGRVRGEKNSEIPSRDHHGGGWDITIEPTSSKFSSDLAVSTQYSQLLRFRSSELMSIAQFITECVGPTMALLQICWRQPVGPEDMYLTTKDNLCQIVTSYLPEAVSRKRLQGWRSLIFEDQMDWGRWFDFCVMHRNVAMLLGDLMSTRTGYLQNQLLNACILLEDLAKIAFQQANPDTKQDLEWGVARSAAIKAASEFGFEHLISSKLPKSLWKTLGPVTNYVASLIKEFDLGLGDAVMTGRVIVGARNPVAHTSKDSGDHQEMITILEGATALAVVGLFKLVFGHDVARDAADKLGKEVRDFNGIIPDIIQRDFTEF